MRQWFATFGPGFRAAGPSAWFALAILALVVVAALAAPLGGYPVGADVDPLRASLSPSASDLLGTDHLGRDVAARLVLATRAFVLPAILAMGVGTLVGVPLGAASGMSEGVGRVLLGFPARVLGAIPRLVLVLLVLSVYGNTATLLGLAMGIATVPAMHEAVYERIAALRDSDYVLANRVHGVPAFELVFGHLILGACGGRIARVWLRALAATLVLEATLSYLGGFGVQEPAPSWGNMIVFEWGRGLGAQALAPAAALLLTLWACQAATGLFQEPSHG